MKKKILFTAYDLNIGGVESCLVNLVNNIDYDKYDVTILLQQKRGDLLKYVNNEVKIEGYNLSKVKFTLLRKAINMFKIMHVKLKHYHKYDFSACYGTGYKASAKLAFLASKNNAIWMHTNIVQFIKNGDHVKGNKSVNEKVEIFLNKIKFRKFKRYIFVSNNAIDAYLNLYPEDKNKINLCHNVIDYNNIIEKSEYKVSDMFEKKDIIFINVSRHTEYDKRLSRLLNAVLKLRKENYKFKLIMIGDGDDHTKYQKFVQKNELGDYVVFYGKKDNPFPYLKMADASLLCSQFEGFPTTFTEAMTLNVPIITTSVSDSQSFIKDKYGIVVDNNDEGIYYGMKQFLDNGFIIKNKFNPEKYNKESIEKLYKIIENIE